MVTVDISVLGDKELSKSLGRLEMKMQKSIVRKALRKAARPVLDSAKSLVPVMTGKLKDSLRIRTLKSRRGTVNVIVETGKRSELGISPNDKYFYPVVVEYKHKSFMRAAIDARRTDAYEIAKREIRAGIEAAI